MLPGAMSGHPGHTAAVHKLLAVGAMPYHTVTTVERHLRWSNAVQPSQLPVAQWLRLPSMSSITAKLTSCSWHMHMQGMKPPQPLQCSAGSTPAAGSVTAATAAVSAQILLKPSLLTDCSL